MENLFCNLVDHSPPAKKTLGHYKYIYVKYLQGCTSGILYVVCDSASSLSDCGMS